MGTDEMTVIISKRLSDTLQISYIKQFVFTIMIFLYVFDIKLFYIFHSVLPFVFLQFSFFYLLHVSFKFLKSFSWCIIVLLKGSMEP